MSSKHSSSPSTTNDSILLQNCRPEWPVWTCTVCNLAGLVSTAIWFTVLFPQLVKNWRRQSVKGLSLLWAIANFTASLINLLFVFHVAQLALYIRISAVYMPVLEMGILLQFLVYDNLTSTRNKAITSSVCVTIWFLILLFSTLFQIADKLVWISIVLWSIETIPQIFLNMKLKSTIGQATLAVVLGLVGKMTDFVSANGLHLPIQYVIMAYFSSSTAYFNGLQLVLYYRHRRRGHSASRQLSDSAAGGGDDVITDARRRESSSASVPSDDAGEDLASIYGSQHSMMASRRMSPSCLGRSLLLSYLILALIFYALGFVWNTGSFWAGAGPVSLVVTLIIGYLVIRKRARSYSNDI